MEKRTKMDRKVDFLVSEDLLELVDEEARNHGMNRSDFLRWCVMEKLLVILENDIEPAIIPSFP